MELSTVARYGLNPIIIVLDNQGYPTERGMLDGPFNDLHPWRFDKVPELLGRGKGFVVETEGQLDAALREAAATTDTFCILDVRLARHDSSPALRRLSTRLATQV